MQKIRIVTSLFILMVIACYARQGTDTWQVKSKTGQEYTLKLVDPFVSQECADQFFDATGTVFAKAFAPLYPEAGLKTYCQKHKIRLDGEKGLNDLSPEKKEDIVQILKNDREELTKYAQEYFFDNFKTDRIERAKKQYAQSEPSFFALYKDKRIIGFAFFTRAFLQDDGIMSFEPDTVRLTPLAIDPEFQGQGLAHHLIFAIRKKFPDTKKIILSTMIEKDIITGELKFLKAYNAYLKYGFLPYIEPNVEYDKTKKRFLVWEKCKQKTNPEVVFCTQTKEESFDYINANST